MPTNEMCHLFNFWSYAPFGFFWLCHLPISSWGKHLKSFPSLFCLFFFPEVADKGVFVLLPTPPAMFYFSIQHSKQNKYSVYTRMLLPWTFLPPQDTRFYFVMYTLTTFYFPSLFYLFFSHTTHPDGSLLSLCFSQFSPSPDEGLI